MSLHQRMIASSSARLLTSRKDFNLLQTLLPKRRRMRAMVVTLLVLALTIAPLPLSKSFIPAAQAQIIPVCGGASHIFQGCPTFDGTLENTLEDEAINEILAFHQLPPTDRDRLLGWARGEIRAQLFDKVFKYLRIGYQRGSYAADRISDAFNAKVKARRILAAQYALQEFNSWNANKCAYTPPAGYSYSPGAPCYGITGAFSGDPEPPTFEEFAAFGTARAFEEFYQPDTQRAASDAARGIALTTGFAGSAIAGVVLGLELYGIAGNTILQTIIPFAFRAALNAVTGAEIPAVGATAGSLAAPVAIIVFAVTTAITRGIDVFAAANLPNKLQQTITDAQNGTGNNLSALGMTYKKEGKQELYAHFILMTMRDYPGTDPIPAPQTTDGQFRVQPQVSTTVNTSYNLNYKSWDDEDIRTNHTARLNNGWFIDKDDQNKESFALSLHYLNWQGERWTASRQGTQFVHTKDAIDGDPKMTFVSSDIQYQDWSGNKFKATLNLPVLGVKGETIFLNRDATSQTVQIGEVTTGGQTVSALQVEGAASATITGVTVSNLAVNNLGQVTASLSANCGSSRASFTLTVKDNINQSKSATFYVSLTPVSSIAANPLPATLPNGKVGVPYNAFVLSSILGTTCAVTRSLSLNTGQLPHGLTLGQAPCDPTQPICLTTDGTSLFGTPTSGGTYSFSLLLHFSNGDDLIAGYTIKIESNVVEAPAGMTSWWRADGNPYDVIGNYQGKLMGSNVSFDEGLIRDAFDFNPLSIFSSPSAYVALPPEIFPFPTTGVTANQPFSYEFWFNTASGGALLGQQNVAPGTTAPTKFIPAIYIGLDSKLRVEMFDNGTINPITTPNGVPKHIWNHVAVVYDGTNEIAYLNGQEFGRAQHTQRGYANAYFYQLGTAYAAGWPGGASGANLAGWFNYLGLLDEPSFYNRALSTQEVKAIFAAGDAGKMRLNAVATNPFCNGGNTGTIQLKVDGGVGLNQYSIDAGNRYQDANFFSDLLARQYQVKVKDALGHTLSKTVTLNNPAVLSFTTSQVQPSCFVASNGSITVNATGGSGTWMYSKDNGQNFQPSNVFANLASGTYKLVVKDATACATAAQSVTLTNGNPTLTYPANPGTTYGTALTITPLTKPSDKGIASTFSVLNPPVNGITVDSAGVVSVANIVPAGNYTVNVRATDTCSGNLDASFTLAITKGTPVITWNPPAFLPTGTLSASVLNATTNAAGSFSYTPSAGTVLAAGSVSLSASFTPSDAQNYNPASKSVTLPVLDSACGTTVNPVTLPAATRGTPFVQTLSGSPVGSYTFSLLAGTLPPGVSLVNTLGIYSLRGTPTTAGTYQFTIKASKNNSTCAGARTYTVVVP